MKLSAIKAGERRVAGCEGKHRFTSFALASKMASRAAHRKSAKMGAYPCKVCGGFHVGQKRATGELAFDHAFDQRKPFLVFARGHDGREQMVGRASTADGGKLAQIMAKDGWTVTRVIQSRKTA